MKSKYSPNVTVCSRCGTSEDHRDVRWRVSTLLMLLCVAVWNQLGSQGCSLKSKYVPNVTVCSRCGTLIPGFCLNVGCRYIHS